MPDSLKPPNGCRSTSAPVILRLMYRLPTRNSRRTRAMFSGLREYRPPVSAYGVPLAISSASIEVARLQHRQHRPEDLLLCQRRRRARRRRRCAARRNSLRPPASRARRRTQPALALAFLDGIEDALLGFLVDHRADGAAGILGRGDLQAARRLDQPRHERVVDRLQHDDPRARRALLALRSRRRCRRRRAPPRPGRRRRRR